MSAQIVSTITDHVNRLAAIYASNDTDAYFAQFRDDATMLVGGFGQWRKADYQAAWGGIVKAGGGASDVAVRDLAVAVSPAGDAAVATLLLDVSYRGLIPGVPMEQAVPMQLAMTEVWFLQGGIWRVSHMAWATNTPPAA